MSGVYAEKGGASPDRSTLIMYVLLLGIPALCALAIYLMAAAQREEVRQDRETMREAAIAVAAYREAIQ